MNDFHKEENEVIGFLFEDGKGYFGQLAVDEFKKGGKINQFITRGVTRLMSAADLGEKWGRWADTMPTLFLKSDFYKKEP